MKAEVRFSVYPNPADGTVTILTDYAALVAKEYKMTDKLGREVRKGQLDNREQQVDLSDLPKGSYFLRIGNTSKHLIIH